MSDTSHHPTSVSESVRDSAPRKIFAASALPTTGLAIVAVACLVLAACDAIWGLPIARWRDLESGGSHAPLLLVTAAAIAILPRIRRLKFGDLEVEAMRESVESLKSDVRFLANDRSESSAVGGLEELIQAKLLLKAGTELPIQRPPPRVPATGQERLPPLSEERERYLLDHAAEGWDSDPNKDRFGGKAASNGREVLVRAVPVAGPQSSICKIRIQVRSQTGSPKLTGSVRLYLHPTFGEHAVQDLEVDASGCASDEITAAGAFVIGVIADEGETRLEYDLKQAPGATRAFKNG